MEEKKRLEELARLEEEERARIEAEEQRRLEEEEAYRKEEAARLLEEDRQVSQLIERQIQMQQVVRKAEEARVWTKYLACQQERDMSEPRNFYYLVSRLQEAKVTTIAEFKAACELIDEAEEAHNSLEKLYFAHHIQEELEKKKEKSDQIFELRELLEEKYLAVQNWDFQQAEEHVRKRLRELADDERQRAAKPEVIAGHRSASFSVGMWIMSFENAGGRPTPIHLPEPEALAELPKSLFNQKLVMYFRRKLKADFLPGTNLGIRFLSYRCLGSPFLAGCFEYPAESVESGGWVIKRSCSNREALRPLTLPALNGPFPVFKVYVMLPPHVFVADIDEVSSVYYDEDRSEWTADNMPPVTQESQNGEARCYVVGLPKMGLASLLVRNDTEFPYVEFRLRCVSSKLLLTIRTARLGFSVEFNGDRLKLVTAPSPQFDDLIGKQLEVVDFLFELSQHNVVLPISPSLIFDNRMIKKKLPELQDKALPELCRIAHKFHVQMSFWNRSSPSSMLIVRVRPNPATLKDFYSDIPQDWQTLAIHPNKVEALQIKENSPEFSMARVEGTLSHLNCSLLIQKNLALFGVEEYNEDISDQLILQMETARQFMDAINLVQLSS